METIFANAQPGIVVCEVTIKGKGQFRTTESTTHPILGWRIGPDAGLVPVTISRHRPDALRLIFDGSSKRYFGLDGQTYADFKQATSDLWAASDAMQESPQEP